MSALTETCSESSFGSQHEKNERTGDVRNAMGTNGPVREKGPEAL